MNKLSKPEYEDLRATRMEEMTKCMTIAFALGTLFGEVLRDEAAGVDVRKTEFAWELKWDDVDAIIREHFRAPIHPKRFEELHDGLQSIIFTEMGITSCAIWEFAHLLDHTLYDDLKNL